MRLKMMIWEFISYKTFNGAKSKRCRTGVHSAVLSNANFCELPVLQMQSNRSRMIILYQEVHPRPL